MTELQKLLDQLRDLETSLDQPPGSFFNGPSKNQMMMTHRQLALDIAKLAEPFADLTGKKDGCP